MRINCKKCRRVGESLCGREKCAFKSRPYAPGMLDSQRKHRSSVSEYGLQLKEKQKLRYIYGLNERQLSNYVKEIATVSKKMNIAPNVALIQMLESRLDNVVYRLGLAVSRALARQMVSHGHIMLNNKKVTIASIPVHIDDAISIREGSKSIKIITLNIDKIKDYKLPGWLLNNGELSYKVSALPTEMDNALDLSKVLEYYSR